MPDDGQTTSWNLLQDAASPDGLRREEFVSRYGPSLRAWLERRWAVTPLRGEVEDALQEVFLDCFRPDGVLARAQPGQGAGFRAFLFGVARKVALRHEERQARRPSGALGDTILEQTPGRHERASLVMDRAWALDVVRAAHGRLAGELGARPEVGRVRLEILRLRFEEQQPVRKIAALMERDAAWVHKEYARARQGFRDALIEEIRARRPDDVFDAEAECVRLLGLLADP